MINLMIDIGFSSVMKHIYVLVTHCLELFVYGEMMNHVHVCSELQLHHIDKSSKKTVLN